ncbi:aminotransferase class IV [Kribbella pratensis]|jgi:branched-chain amino acid aminotransferase|uniref:Branched-chain amino acid aminotransferase n=1 Tax=Kribbella pratensis TaxID=2512112 RepID=A0A4R8CIM9_9ACTN|nr:aminotransferase class IV [Kribbella pratensis]TDW75635.1 branched-chain amino acid aminotransferase [Kribbella pratensis]
MAHTASISQLQTPPWALVNGELVPYTDVKIHIGAEALTRALSVFEGVKGYWDTAGEVFSIRTPRRHYDRLRRSASLFHIPVRFSYDQFLAGLEKLAGELLVTDKDLWFRPTMYVTHGHWGEATEADLVVTAFSQRKLDPDPMRLGVTSWRRASDLVLPTRVKSSANYVGARMARIEVRRLGYDDAIMLNDAGRVAEATGACVLMVQRGRIVTPPTSESCLDSITVDILEEVAKELGMPFDRRPIERTELLAADECGLAGTISELTLVSELDGVEYDQTGLLAQLRQRYLELMRGDLVLPGVELAPLADVSRQLLPAEAGV